MRKETILKILLVLTIGVMMFVLPTNVLAADTGFDDFWEDQGGLTDIQPEQKPETQPEPEKQPEQKPQTQPEQQKPNTDIPKAGLVEDTMMFAGIVVLVITAVYAYKKVNEYKNI